MDYRQTTCSLSSSKKIFLGPCQSHKRKEDIVNLYYPTTSPTPSPKSGDRNGGGFCDCTVEYNGIGSGSNWGSAFVNQMEQWQDNNTDMLHVQSFAKGGSSSYNNCNNYGFKNVAAYLPWYGTYGFTSNDACGALKSIGADQNKYTKWTIDALLTYHTHGGNCSNDYNSVNTAGGSVTIDTNTGLIESTINTVLNYDEQDYHYSASICVPDGPQFPVIRISGGSGSYYDKNGITATYPYGLSTDLDILCFTDTHCENTVLVPSFFDLDNTAPMNLNVYPERYNTFYAAQCADTSSANFIMDCFPVPLDINSYTGYASVLQLSASDLCYQKQLTCSWLRTSSSFEWLLSYNYIAGPCQNDYYAGVQTVIYQGTITLSNVNSVGNIMGAANSLLGTWDLTNNAIYPWRTDNNTMYAPLVTKRGVQYDVTPIQGFIPYLMLDYRSPIGDKNGNSPFTTITDPPPAGWTYAPDNNDCSGHTSSSIDYGGPCDWVPTWTTMKWEDPASFYWIWKTNYDGFWADSKNSNHFDGAIIGQPLTYDISGSMFGSASLDGIGFGWHDFYYIDYRYCAMPLGGGCSGVPYERYKYRYGGTMADAEISVAKLTSGGQFSTFLPQSATHWTNNPMAYSIPKGASILTGFNLGGVVCVKWAETRIPFPSYNYFRPCGSDRVLVDETTVQCFIDDALTMSDPLTGLTGGSQVLVACNPTHNGIYTGCSQTGNVLTLGTKIADLPTDYLHDFSAEYADPDVLGNFGMVGLVRFPNAWPICGRQAINITGSVSGSVSGSNILFLTPQTNLRTNDKLALFNNGMGVLYPLASVLRIDDNTFFVPINSTSSISASVYAMASGSPDYHWDDTTSKYEFRYNDFLLNNRTSTESAGTCQSDCLPFSNCSEQVVCFSPNGEVFTNGKTLWFTNTSSLVLDGIYGASNQMNVDFSMNDILWQTPKCPCTNFGVQVSCDMDSGNCVEPFVDPDTGVYHLIYAHSPQVEGMCSLPSGAPALPAGVSFPAMSRPLQPGHEFYDFQSSQQPWNFYDYAITSCDGCRFHYYWC